MRPRIIAVAVAVAVVVAGVGLWIQTRRGDHTDTFEPNGPIRNQNASAYSIPIELGRRFTDGFTVLQVTGTAPAKILTIQSVQDGSSLKYLGALIAGQDRLYASDQSLAGYPPQKGNLGLLLPAEGFTMLPDSQTPDHNGYELLLGYAFTGEKVTFRRSVVVTYESAGIDYQMVVPSQVVACPPAHDLEKCLNLAHLN